MKPVRSSRAKELARHLEQQIGGGALGSGAKLPAERELSLRFGASRGSVRRVLADMRERGLIVQLVGSGTFVTEHARAALGSNNSGTGDGADPSTANVSPAELMQARRLIEPLMPALIARNANADDFARMRQCLEQSESAASTDVFEHWDGQLHQTFAAATHNAFFMQLLVLTNRVREQGEWGRLKRNSLTAERRAQYESQHRDIVDALCDRDAARAAALLVAHLDQIQRNLFGE